MSAILDTPHLVEKCGEAEKDEIRLIFRLDTIVNRVTNQKILSALGISFSHGRALLHLARSPGVSCGELAQLLGCGTSRISRLIQELETRQLVECRRGGTDRRVLQVSLTPNGAALACRVPAVFRDAELTTFSVLPDDDCQRLVKLLSRMVSNLNRLGE